jgi:O-antigen/teichoic acid export membrane protein
MSNNLTKLAGQVAIYGISSVIARLLNYLLVPYYTRIMTPAEYGVITDIYALIPFALVVLTLGMESGYFRFAAKATTREEKSRVFGTTWGAVLTASTLFLAAALLFNAPLSAAMGYSGTPYVIFTALIIFFDVAGAIPFARLRQEGRALHYVAVRLFSVVLNIALCLWFYNGNPQCFRIFETPTDPGYAIVANLIASALSFAILLWLSRGGRPRFSGKILRTIFLYSLPLLVSGIAGTANEFIDRQMIKFLMPAEEGLAALGIYGAVVKIGVVMLLFTQMYRLAAEPFFLAEFKKDEFKNSNAEVMKYFVIVSLAIFLFITLFADLFALIVGPAFREGMYILPMVLVSNALSGVVLNLSFWYKQSGATKYAIWITGTGLVFTVVFNILLVPTLGYAGAALARLLCELAMVLVSYRLNQRHCPTPYNLKRIALYAAVTAALWGLSLLTEELPAIAKYLTNSAMLALFVVFVVRRERINIGGLVRSVLRRK